MHCANVGSVPLNQSEDIQQIIQELDIQINHHDPKDIAELNMIVSKYLFYPSDGKAQLHEDAFRLGDID